MRGPYHVLLLSVFALLGNCGQPKTVYRTDSRGPAEVSEAGGLTTPASRNGLPPDDSIWNHLAIGKNAKVGTNDGYLGTSSNFKMCATQWVGKYSHGSGNTYVYDIAATSNFIDVVSTMRDFCPYSEEEEEFASLGNIPWNQIRGWVKFENFNEVSREENPEFQAAHFANSEAGGAQYQYAKFPRNHKAWKKDPWKAYAPLPDPAESSGAVSSGSNKKGRGGGKNKKKSGSGESSGGGYQSAAAARHRKRSQLLRRYYQLDNGRRTAWA